MKITQATKVDVFFFLMMCVCSSWHWSLSQKKKKKKLRKRLWNPSARFSNLSPLLQETQFPLEYLRVPRFRALIITCHCLPNLPPAPHTSELLLQTQFYRYLVLKVCPTHTSGWAFPSATPPFWIRICLQLAPQGFAPLLTFEKLCSRLPVGISKMFFPCPSLSQVWIKGFLAPTECNKLN